MMRYKNTPGNCNLPHSFSQPFSLIASGSEPGSSTVIIFNFKNVYFLFVKHIVVFLVHPLENSPEFHSFGEFGTKPGKHLQYFNPLFSLLQLPKSPQALYTLHLSRGSDHIRDHCPLSQLKSCSSLEKLITNLVILSIKTGEIVKFLP
ncbi:hypothetical protein CsSME_00027138 [Camellia sinensis var. sinensis]